MAHPNLDTPGNSTELLQSWRHRARMNQKAHYKMAQRTQRLSFWFGTIAAVLSGIVGILILFVAKDPATWLRLTAAGISILVSVITTISTSAKWSDKAGQHHAAGAAYGVLHRRLEEALAFPAPSEAAARTVLEEVRTELDSLPMKAPSVPDAVWKNLPDELTPDKRVGSDEPRST